MPAYKDQKTGSWYVSIRYTDWTGKKKQTMKRGFRTKREAQDFEIEFKRKAAADMNMMLKDFIDIYFEDKKNSLKENSIRNKKHMIETHVLPYFGLKKMNEITASDIISWQNIIREKNYKPTYERMLNNQINALFNHAQKIYKLQENPCKHVKRMGKADAKKVEFWTEEEFYKFLQVLEPGTENYLIAEILFWTGIREGELLALTPQNIDLEKNLIEINETYTRIGKRDVITTPKTETSIRKVHIPEFLKEEIKEYLSGKYQMPKNERIFTIVSRTLQKRMDKAIEKAGVKKIRVHDLRHSHVAYLIHQGVPAIVIKERLGHKDIRITMNTYGHLYPSEQTKVAEMLDKNRNVRDS